MFALFNLVAKNHLSPRVEGSGFEGVFVALKGIITIVTRVKIVILGRVKDEFA